MAGVCGDGEFLREVRRERGYLHMLAHVLDRFDRVGKVAVPADEDGRVVQVVPRELQQVGRYHDVHALFDGDRAAHLRAAKASLDVRRVVESSKELLLVLIRLRISVGVPQHVVVVDAEQIPPIRQLLPERSKVYVEAPAIFLEAVIEVAAVDEDANPYRPTTVSTVALICHCPSLSVCDSQRLPTPIYPESCGTSMVISRNESSRMSTISSTSAIDMQSGGEMFKNWPPTGFKSNPLA